MLIFSHIGCTWLGVCGCTSSNFLVFNIIGVDIKILIMTGNQTWVSQSGTTRIPSSLSCFTFENTFGMDEIGENAWNLKSDQSIVNASIYIAPGSRLIAAYFPDCVLILVANRSTFGLKHKYFNSRFKSFNLSIYSVSTWFDWDSLSATVFSFPEMWANERQF